MKNPNKKDDIYLSVIVPVYNEQNRISSTLEHIFEYLKNKDFSSEIIIVDDGSHDDTLNVILDVSKKNNFPVVILKNDKNRGKGFTIKKGVLKSSGKFILFSDGSP